MIVDQAEEDFEMAQDPFLEAGVSIPPEMPYQDKVPQNEKKQNLNSSRVNLENAEEKSIDLLPPNIEIMNDM